MHKRLGRKHTWDESSAGDPVLARQRESRSERVDELSKF